MDDRFKKIDSVSQFARLDNRWRPGSIAIVAAHFSTSCRPTVQASIAADGQSPLQTASVTNHWLGLDFTDGPMHPSIAKADSAVRGYKLPNSEVTCVSLQTKVA